MTESAKAKKKFYNDRAYAKKMGLTLEEYQERQKAKATYQKDEKERRRIYERRAYAKKLGITVEELDARQKAKAEGAKKVDGATKERRKKWRTEARVKRRQAMRKDKTIFDEHGRFTMAYRLRLKAKHAAFEGTRLSESVNKPELLP